MEPHSDVTEEIVLDMKELLMVSDALSQRRNLLHFVQQAKLLDLQEAVLDRKENEHQLNCDRIKLFKSEFHKIYR